jgi:uncharacterized protein YerC
MERELTALEHRLYKFLDDMDSILEFDMLPQRWSKMNAMVKKCKEDCRVEFGVVNNGYSTHIQLPFDISKINLKGK